MKKNIFVFILSFISFFIFNVMSYAADPDKFVGTYDITYFMSKSGIYVFNSDIEICDKHKYALKSKCRIHPTEIILGKAQITKNDDGKYVLETKMQIYNKFISTSTPSDLYNYSKYGAVNLVKGVLNGDNKEVSVVGRNLTEKYEMPKTMIKVYEEDDVLVADVKLFNKCVMAMKNKMNIGEVTSTMYLKKQSNKTNEDFHIQKKLLKPKKIDSKVWESYVEEPKEESNCK